MTGTGELPGGTGTHRRIGIICNDDHDVFSAVGDRIADAGHDVRFFEPGRRVPDPAIDRLDLLMNKKVDPESFRALSRAEARGVPTWNGTTTMLLGARLVGYRALDAAGARVPAVSLEKPDGDYVAKTFFDWHFQPDPERNGDGDLYQEFVPAGPLDFKYYAVDDGDQVRVRVLLTRSKLHGPKEKYGVVAPDPGLAGTVRRLLALTGSQAIGVDFVRADGQYWAVDVNPAMSFRGAGLADALVESVLATLPVRAPGRGRYGRRSASSNPG